MDLIFYCDESCHIQFDHVEYMSLVTVFCSKSRTKNINRDIRKIKEKYSLDYKVKKWLEMKFYIKLNLKFK